MDSDFSFSKQSEYLDKLVQDLVKEGMPISEVMNMPYNYMIDIMVERQEEHHSNSFFDLLG